MVISSSLVIIPRELVRVLIDETAQLPRWSRPFVVTILCVLITVAYVLVSPFLLLSRRWRGQARTLREIEAHLERLWYEESPDTAVARLRDILARARSASDMRLSIEPYGEVFSFEADYELSRLLYRYEAARGNWQEALEVAEYLIRAIGGEKKGGAWLLTKAQCLMKLRRNAEVREFLFRIRDRDELRSDADRLLANLPRPTHPKEGIQPTAKGDG